MTRSVDLVDEFQAARPRLLSLAHRMVGSLQDAEDAVQEAWLRTRSAPDRLDNPAGWFTHVTARLCLDQLRARQRRDTLPLLGDAVPDERQLDVDEQFLVREDVSRALLVLLDRLTPVQRVAYVLHDLFGVAFDDVAGVLETSPANAKKAASRARTRLRPDAEVAPAGAGHTAEHTAVVEAFLDAARGGDLARMVALLAPDVVRTVDPALVPAGTATEVTGAMSVAGETRSFADRIAVSALVAVDGRPGAVIARGGHATAVIRLDVAAGRVTRIAITPVTSRDRLTALPTP